MIKEEVFDMKYRREEQHKENIYIGGLCPDTYWQQFQNKKR
jgi:hypothetical protein